MSVRRLAALTLLLLVGAAAGSPSPAAATTTAQRLVAVARGELAKNVHEVPDGSNRAPAITRYVGSTSPSWLGAPWCAYFVSWVARQAGVPIGPGGRGLGYVPYIQQWARRTGRWRAHPRPGYLVTWPSHVGIVETVSGDGTMTTIEGNAGNAVRRRFRRTSDGSGFVALAAPGAVSPAPSPALPSLPARPAGPKPTVVRPVPVPLRARITLYPSATVKVGDTLALSANDSSGDITKVRWDFDGDGHFTDAKGDSVTLRVTRRGRFAVAVRVFARGGVHADATTTVTVLGASAPVAQLDMPDEVPVGTTVTADASASTDPDGGTLTYAWDLDGDGHFGADGPQHAFTYTRAGVYRAVVRVTDEDGQTTETSHELTVLPPPPPTVTLTCTPQTVTTGELTTCVADTSASPVVPSRIEWDTNDDGAFGRGGGSVAVTFPDAGPHVVHVRVTGNRQTATADATVTVTDRPPVAAVSAPASARLGDAVRLDASGSRDPDGTIARYRWDVGADGTWDAEGPVLRVTPTVTGPFTALLEVTDGAGQTATATVRVDIRPR